MEEIWKDVVGYEGLYMVSNLGNVKSLNYNHTGKEKNLKISHHYSGYKKVTLFNDAGHKNKTIHILVAKAFIPNQGNLPCVNHKDGNKGNNHVENLEWVTYSQNTRHAINSGLRKDCNVRGVKGEKNKNSKPIAQYKKSGELVKIWPCISDAARYYGGKPCTIINCSKGRIKSCYGYVWKQTGV